MKLKILSLLLMCACVRGIPPGLLYEIDAPGAQYLPAEDDVSSKEIQLRVPVVFYGTTYHSIFVCVLLFFLLVPPTKICV